LRDHVDEHLAAAVQRVRTLEVIGYVAAGMDAAEGLVNRGIDDQRHVGHRKGTTEIYAKFDPDYLGKARFAINAWMSDLSRDVPRLRAVSRRNRGSCESHRNRCES